MEGTNATPIHQPSPIHTRTFQSTNMLLMCLCYIHRVQTQTHTEATLFHWNCGVCDNNVIQLQDFFMRQQWVTGVTAVYT